MKVLLAHEICERLPHLGARAAGKTARRFVRSINKLCRPTGTAPPLAARTSGVKGDNFRSLPLLDLCLRIPLPFHVGYRGAQVRGVPRGRGVQCGGGMDLGPAGPGLAGSVAGSGELWRPSRLERCRLRGGLGSCSSNGALDSERSSICLNFTLLCWKIVTLALTAVGE